MGRISPLSETACTVTVQFLMILILNNVRTTLYLRDMPTPENALLCCAVNDLPVIIVSYCAVVLRRIRFLR